MKALRIVFRSALLIGFVIEFPVLPTSAQTTPPKETQPPCRDCESSPATTPSGRRS